MISNYLKSALRSLRHNKLYTLLNLTGLTIGFTGFLLIALYVVDELMFDRMHANANRICRLIEHKTSPAGTETHTASTSYNLAEGGKSDIAEIEDVVKLTVFGRANVFEKDIKTAIYEPMWLADASFGTMFDFHWLQGDPNTALEKPNSVVMTRTTAQRVYGTEHASRSDFKAPELLS